MPSPSIEFASPTSRAFQGMTRVLFQPFDLGKWFVLGFTAWLASLLDGTGSGGGGGETSSSSDSQSFLPDLDSMGDVADFFESIADWCQENLSLAILLGGSIALLLLSILLVLLWISSRGKFMFLDNVVHNRALVQVPWTQFRSVGNSLFRWRLGFALIVILLFLLILGGTAFAALLSTGELERGVDFAIQSLDESTLLTLLPGLALFLLLLPLLLYIGFLLEDFVIPTMYRNALTATDAWRSFLSLHNAHLGFFLLYALWKILLALAALACIFALGFGTCCIGFILMAIPYISSVVLLPVSVFFRFLGPEFLRQFGGDQDIFGPPPIPDADEVA